MTSLRLYARAHLNTHEFVNNIPVPTEQKKYDLDYVTKELQSGVKDKVDWNSETISYQLGTVNK